MKTSRETPRRTSAARTSKCTTAMVVLATSSYGNQEPRIEISGADPRNFRAMNAAIYRLAAEAEAGSIAEAWCVVVNIHGRGQHPGIHLELSEGPDTGIEAVRGLALLERILPTFCL